MAQNEWISVKDDSEVPQDKTIIAEDECFCMGQAYYEDGRWLLETFGRTPPIYFDKIVRYFILP